MYLYHRSELGEFLLSSDSVIPTFTRWGFAANHPELVTEEENKAFMAISYTIGGMMVWDAYSTISVLQTVPEPTDSEAAAAIDATLTGPTFREQIVRARRGQGVFRANVLLREDSCRVTRVNEPRHLKASHIKPWRDSNDTERLDGANGLLLSPHIDHLFDEGYITFSGSQELVIVPEVRDKLLDAWGIDAGVRVGEFTAEQNAYLDYHRTNVFKHALLE